MRFRTTLFTALIGAAVLAGCSEDALPAPSDLNNVDTVTLGALRSSLVTQPSGYNTFEARPIRTDISGNISEFLYDIDPVLGPVFIPAQAESLAAPSTTNPGLMPMAVPFDSITSAISNGYILDAPLPVDSGDVFMLRSAVRCTIGVPVYGKLEVMSIDTVANTITFQVLVDKNCGYRSLEPGVPSN